VKHKGRIAAAILGVLLAAVAGVWLAARSSSPAVPLAGDPDREDETALREVFQAIGDPRDLPEGEVLELRLTQRQVSALGAEASSRRQRVSARARLLEEAVEVTLSAESPRPWITPYVNLRVTLSGPPDAPVVESATLGDLPIPAALGQAMFDYGLAEFRSRDPIANAALEAVEEVEYGADALTVRVRWTPEVRDRILEAGRAIVRGEIDPARIAVYADALREALAAADGEAHHLTDLLRAVFVRARDRVDGGEAPRREIETAFLVLALYSVEVPLDEALGVDAAAGLPQHVVTIYGRTDLPRHFLVSAVTTLFADRAVADALGLAKELRDAEDVDGSGFSFRDLAADRAGTRLLREATESEARMRALIDRLARPFGESDLVPRVHDLPEGMNAEQFAAAYEDTESERYRALVARIDARTDECDVHRAVAAAR